MGIQINGNTNNINAGIGSLSIEDINELDVTGVVTARSGIKVLAGGINAVGVTTFSGDVYANEGIFLPDTKALKIGNTEGTPDFTISHDTSNTILDNNTGDLILRSDGDDVKILAEDDIVLRDNDDSTNFIHCVNGGGVKLYNNGTQIFETYSSGVTVSGGQVNINPSSGNATLQLKSGSGSVYTNIHFRASDNTQTSYITSWSGGNLYFNTTSALISSIGGTEITEITSTGLHPKTDSSRDLGKTGTRWANAYVDTYYGDGSNLTGITGTTINNNGSNRIITGSSTANTLEGESTFTYNGTHIATINTGQTYATFQLDGNSGGAIEFYENGTRRFELYGIDAEVALYDRDKGAYHTRFKSGGNIELSDGNLLINTTTSAAGNLVVKSRDSSSNQVWVIGRSSDNTGSVSFRNNADNAYTGRIEVEDTNGMILQVGSSDRLQIDTAGQVLPGADDAQNLGSSTKRWKNIYAADMHFSNKGKTNDVDGTWGDWTLQEGEDSVYMINNRTGKKYAITMKEVN